MTTLALENATLQRQERTVLGNVSIQVGRGELVGLLGANGAGKSTLVKSMLGIIKLNSGLSTIDNVNSTLVSDAERARKVAYLPQSRELSWPLSVWDTVALGRYAHGGRLGQLSSIDANAVERAMDACDLNTLQSRRVDQLSGGELSRVHFARALASQAPMMLADEPVAELDPWHQFQLMSFVRKYVNQGNGAVVIMHDPELAARFADRLVWMAEGKVVADGAVADTLTPEQLRRVYSMEADVFWRGSQPQVTMLGPLNR